MIVIPTIDLQQGKCVLPGAAPVEAAMQRSGPVELARHWERTGFARLHLVDRDAAVGVGSNAAHVRAILAADTAAVQVGGGIRTRDKVDDALSDGATYVMVGTRALEDLDWLARLAMDRPGEVILAADVRERRVLSRGWKHTLPMNVLDLVDEVTALPLAGLLVTAVHKAGRMEGADLSLMEDVADAASFPVLAAGGVGQLHDLYLLQDRGVAGAVVGMALYSGAIDPRAAAVEFGND